MVEVEALKDIAKDTAINYGKQKANETLSDPEKFKDTLDAMSKKDAFKKIKNIWDACEESDKEKVYKAGQQKGKSVVEKIVDPLGLGIIETTKQVDPTLATIQLLRYKNNQLKWLKAICPPQTFETTMRFLVQLWLLESPKKITPEVMLEDLQSDTKSVNMKLTTFEAVATIVPYLRPLLPLIQLLRQYVKKLWEISVQQLMAKNTPDMVTAENKEEKKTETNEALLVSKIKESIELKEVLDDKNNKNITKKDERKNNEEVSSEKIQQVRNENKWNAGLGKDSDIEFSKN